MLPSGKQATYKNRITWARIYLSKALLLEGPKRGFFRTTERGRELLKFNPAELRVKHLKKYPEFVEFCKTGSKQEKGGESAVSSEQSLDGKLFVQFIALIFLFSVTRKMQQSNLFNDFTMQEVLGEFDIIECFEVPGQKLQVGETTKRQMDLYTKFGAAPLTSLQ